MYNASSAFHTAVANGAHQIALLIFSDAVFTNDDINVSVGIEFNDYFNTEEDLTIGMALSNEISFNLFNDRGLLDEYEFGDFLATIGAQIAKETVTDNGIQVQSASHTYIAYKTSPYLKRDGNAVNSQPAAPIRSMLFYDGYVYCLLENDVVAVYKDSNGAKQNSMGLNDFMKAQMAKWEGKGISYIKNTRILKIRKGTEQRTYEFVPLGWFKAERPNVPTVNEIHFTCYDWMQKFEEDMPPATDLELTYPCTIGTLYTKMCDYLRVNYRTSTFINSTATISAKPEQFDTATMRDVLQWIAEAAGSIARFSRDGVLVMDWIRTTNQSINENGYSEFNPYWYETKKVTKLHNRASDGSYQTESGSGDEAYLIQDNPLLQGVS